ncbi:hypothetical protein GCM10009779_35880 [Polymorphospora rubra]|uniref:Uncharacterized protein n=1 Tax=Polymorphospora rubra TaxID=338584 RepID=A0A810NAL0_9ACTN|nr:hypothetical protein Prubr_72780 [Polymorphospora rubra]
MTIAVPSPAEAPTRWAGHRRRTAGHPTPGTAKNLQTRTIAFLEIAFLRLRFIDVSFGSRARTYRATSPAACGQFGGVRAAITAWEILMRRTEATTPAPAIDSCGRRTGGAVATDTA